MKYKTNDKKKGFIPQKRTNLEEKRKIWSQKNVEVRADEAKHRISQKQQKMEEENKEA
ncbi:MAG: hypothetical protein AAF329_25795 [Cyanobacteria bacterium P01_A01_bin.17]